MPGITARDSGIEVGDIGVGDIGAIGPRRRRGRTGRYYCSARWPVRQAEVAAWDAQAN